MDIQSNKHRNDARSPSLDASCACFVILKPDAHALGIVEEIIDTIMSSGLTIERLHSTCLTPAMVRMVWPAIRSWTGRTISYMTSGTSTVALVRGSSATEHMIKIKRDFRSRYPDPNPVVSVLHTSDCDTELYAGLEIFWPDMIYGRDSR